MTQSHYNPFELGKSWQKALEKELDLPYIKKLAAFVEQERELSPKPIFPPKELTFTAFKKTPYENAKVLIMGQDPYHGLGQAHGLSFSVPKGIPLPPSLQNIYKELESDLGITSPPHGCLLSWAEQGVMLLNAILTVRQGEPLSHQGKGWELFTDAVIAKLYEREDPMIFLLWGKYAQEKVKHIENIVGSKRHVILTAPHPSPFSARHGFFGCRHFSKVNAFLQKMGKKEIQWEIPL